MVGAVYDRGYRPYDGDRGGQAAARAALFRATVRRALGIRRPWRQKLPFALLLGIGVIPAVVNVGVSYLTRDTIADRVEFITYRGYMGVSNALLVFVALTAPDIMCPDRRQRVLPLLFARPLTGLDYVIAKVGAMFAILFAFSFVPQVVLFVGQTLVSEDGALNYVRDNAEVMWQVPIAVTFLAIFYAAIGVAVSSLTSRRIIAGASIVGLFLVTSIVSGVLVGPETETVREEGSSFEGPPSSLGPNDEGVIVIPPPGEEDRTYVLRDETSAAPLLDLLMLPLILRDLVFLGHVEDIHPMSGLTNGGLYAILVFIAVLIVSFIILYKRYDEVER
jgi:ABC-2 type transport system permease protein